MKAILEFDLNDELDAEKYDAALQAPDLKYRLEEFDDYLRNLAKYESEGPEASKWAKYFRKELLDRLGEYL